MTDLIVPEILNLSNLNNQIEFPLDEAEINQLKTAGNLYKDGYYPQALLEVWNASSINLRRRIEAYGIELFKAAVDGENGRKAINLEGEDIFERWENVDDVVLVKAAKNMGLISKKAAKALETVLWMRNHASSAHPSEDQVDNQEVIHWAGIIQASLLSQPLPNPGYSVSGIFKPIRSYLLGEEQILTLRNQIESFSKRDMKAAFGFLIDALIEGDNPAYSNAKSLLPIAWGRTTEDQKKSTGLKYHALFFEDLEDSESKQAQKTRLLEFLLEVKGIKYIPDGSRTVIYRKLARNLHEAKNTSYGWNKEENTARAIQQFGTYVPDSAFDEFYQEVLAVWCGNHWGRSDAYYYLQEFIDSMQSQDLRKIVELFNSNERVQEELHQSKPKSQAITLLERIREKLPIEANKNEVDDCMRKIEKMEWSFL